MKVESTNSLGVKFRLIPPGEFTMGSTREEIDAALKEVADDKHWQECIQSEAPQHKVILTQPIFLGIREVTQADYEQIPTALRPAKSEMRARRPTSNRHATVVCENRFDPLTHTDCVGAKQLTCTGERNSKTRVVLGIGP